MSKYQRIKVSFTNGESLKRALEDLGLQVASSANLTDNDQVLETHWKGFGGVNQPAAIAVSKAEWAKVCPGNYDGIGFSWNGESYDCIVDHLDQNSRNGIAALNQVRQRYAYHEVQRGFRENGWYQQSADAESGQIHLVFSQY